MSKKPVRPQGLGPAGIKLWNSIIGKYVLRADELMTLESACRATDRIAAMEDERNGAIMAVGSMGQDVVHPLIAEIRAHEAQVGAMLAKLKLPDDPANPAAGQESRSTQARDAANSRWAAAHGKGA